jgi:hypothetical protein
MPKGQSKMAPDRGPLFPAQPVRATFRPLRLDAGLLAVGPTAFRLDHDAWTAAVLDHDAWTTAMLDHDGRTAAVLDNDARAAAVLNVSGTGAADVDIDLRQPGRIGLRGSSEQRCHRQRGGRRQHCEYRGFHLLSSLGLT